MDPFVLWFPGGPNQWEALTRSKSGVGEELGQNMYSPALLPTSLPEVCCIPELMITYPVLKPSPYSYHLPLGSGNCYVLLPLQAQGQ